MVSLNTTRPPLSPGGIAGLTSIALALLGNAIRPIWTFPGTSASATHLTTFVTAHSSQLKLTMVVYAISVALWMVFGASVTVRLRAAAPPTSSLPHCFTAGLIGFVSLLFAGFTCFDVLVYRTPDPAAATVLYDLAFGMLAMSGLPTAVALISFAIAVRRYRAFHPSTGWIAAVAGTAHVLLIVSFVFGSGVLSLESALMITGIPLLLFLWIGQTSTTLRRGSRESPA